MAFDTIALSFGVLMGVPGLLFMVKNKDTVKNAIDEAGFGSKYNTEMLAIASYYLFLAGMMLFGISMMILGLDLGLPAALAVCAALGGPLSVLGFMAITKQSITGIPGISGPPLPARIALIVIGSVININAIMHGIDGADSAATWIKFFSLYVVAVAVPHLVGFKHRSAGWDMV